ncbi:MAG TPA: hypothetical protein VIR54_32340 [Vicinamibacterales bacterium]
MKNWFHRHLSVTGYLDQKVFVMFLAQAEVQGCWVCEPPAGCEWMSFAPEKVGGNPRRFADLWPTETCRQQCLHKHQLDKLKERDCPRITDRWDLGGDRGAILAPASSIPKPPTLNGGRFFLKQTGRDRNSVHAGAPDCCGNTGYGMEATAWRHKLDVTRAV